jgi:hypothetical protein
MRIRVISHRGFWKSAEEKNTEAAFRRALSSGFGVETDLRDFGNKVVISHDSPDESSMSLEAFLDLYQGFSRTGGVLALNVKADGLQERVKTALRERAVENYFFFDMSVPDALEYKRRNLRYFTRQSEIEPQPALYESAVGVWMDCFFNDWIEQEDILAHLGAGKDVCICSPELHHRDPSGFWARLSRMELSHSRLMLCTDEPQKARDYFNQEG